MTVTFFTRADCSLCRAALYVVERVRRQIPFELTLCDVAAPGNEHWHNLYKHDIPVVHLDGREIFRHKVAESELRRILEAHTPH